MNKEKEKNRQIDLEGQRNIEGLKKREIETEQNIEKWEKEGQKE